MNKAAAGSITRLAKEFIKSIQAFFLQIAPSVILLDSQQSTAGQWPISDCFQPLILQSILYYADLYLIMQSTASVLHQYRYILTKLLF